MVGETKNTVITESAEWVEGIYLLQEDDPVQGGEDGVDNLQAKQLANRTQYLKAELAQQAKKLLEHEDFAGLITKIRQDLAEKAALSSPVLIGEPEAPTATGENKQQITNVEFVENYLANAFVVFAQNNPDSIAQLRSLLNQQDSRAELNLLNQRVARLSLYLSRFGLSDMAIPLHFAITDKNGKMAYGIKQRGDFYLPEATLRNDSRYSGWAVTDKRDNVLLGYDTSRSQFSAGSTVYIESDGVQSLVDKNYRMAYQVNQDGSMHLPAGIETETGIAYLQAGYVYLQKGGVAQQLTHRGDVVAVQMYGQAVRFIAPRRGVMLTYEWRDGEIRQVFANDTSVDGFIITGQSLAEGGANLAMSKTPAAKGKALMLDCGPVPNSTMTGGTYPVDLQETKFETIASNFAKATLSRKDKTLFIHGAAVGGMSYARLTRGGSAKVYERIVEQMKALLHFPFKLSYKAIFVIHGEADGGGGTDNYDQALTSWLNYFTEDIQLFTKQQEKPVMLLCQTSSAAGYKRELIQRHQFKTPFAQLKATETSPYHYLVCPKYQFDYKDHAHILAKDTQYLGEYYAKVKNEVVDKGNDWVGLRPKQLTKTAANSVEIEFYVSVPPLTFDTDWVSNPSNYGFYLYNSSDVTIQSVELLPDVNKVKITTNGDIPSGATITYAFDNGVGGKSGRTQGARGNLRDSDPTMSLDGRFHLYNWAFAFELPIH